MESISNTNVRASKPHVLSITDTMTPLDLAMKIGVESQASLKVVQWSAPNSSGLYKIAIRVDDPLTTGKGAVESHLSKTFGSNNISGLKRMGGTHNMFVADIDVVGVYTYSTKLDLSTNGVQPRVPANYY